MAPVRRPTIIPIRCISSDIDCISASCLDPNSWLRIMGPLSATRLCTRPEPERVRSACFRNYRNSNLYAGSSQWHAVRATFGERSSISCFRGGASGDRSFLCRCGDHHSLDAPGYPDLVQNRWNREPFRHLTSGCTRHPRQSRSLLATPAAAAGETNVRIAKKDFCRQQHRQVDWKRVVQKSSARGELSGCPKFLKASSRTTSNLPWQGRKSRKSEQTLAPVNRTFHALN